jgi:hypothetical protein
MITDTSTQHRRPTIITADLPRRKLVVGYPARKPSSLGRLLPNFQIL